MQYRREIDGIRSLAVLPVILFHAGFEQFRGGFVGVDVFFVISGYLITGILLAELESGRFSIAGFYERRARRILPALFVVILACLPFAWLWMTPGQIGDFGKSVVAVVFFVSNIFFWSQKGYFGPDEELKPLLHTWSLGVEEQYYLFFPLFLAFAWRFGRTRVFWAVVVMALGSLALSEYASRAFQNANFYLTPTRAWELLAGSIAAFVARGGSPRISIGAANAVTLAALAAVLVPIFLYSSSTPFPGLTALLPVGGTALLILFAGPETLAGRLLGLKPLVGVGLISYSAYLWHQPLFAFARLRSLAVPSPWLMGALSLLSLLLAWLSWRFVEQPFRKGGTLLPTRRPLFIASAVACLAMVGVGLGVQSGGGLAGRFDPALVKLVATGAQLPDETCFYDRFRGLPVHPVKACQHPDAAGHTGVLLLGDSHGLAIARPLGAALAAAGLGHYEMGYRSCVPVPGFRRFGGAEEFPCDAFSRGVLDHAARSGIGTIVFTARFPLYLLGTRFDNGEGGVEAGEPISIDTLAALSVSDDAARQTRVLAELDRQLRRLSHRFRIVLVEPIPEAGWDAPTMLFKQRVFTGSTGDVTTPLERYQARSAAVMALFDRLEREEPNIRVARVARALCNPATGRCSNTHGQRVLYQDDDHLSPDGAALVVPIIMQAITRASPPATGGD
jgi:peptidoglycan/LPS O-acetylase OafA/YrhL